MPIELLKFCDAPLHFHCLETWPHREAFSEASYEANVPSDTGGLAVTMLRSTRWALVSARTVPGRLPPYADVRLRDWPFRMTSSWKSWNTFVGGRFRKGLAGVAVDVAESVMATVRADVPDVESLTALYHQIRAG